jgi:hypothetical protein
LLDKGQKRVYGTKLKPLRAYLAPGREQLTKAITLFSVDYVFRRIFIHPFDALIHPSMLNHFFRKKLPFWSFLKISSANL